MEQLLAAGCAWRLRAPALVGLMSMPGQRYGDIPILPKRGLRNRKFNLLSEVVVKLGFGPCLFNANIPSCPYSSLYEGNAHPECVSNRLLGGFPVLSRARELITQTGI